jgi:hypothetical protein
VFSVGLLRSLEPSAIHGDQASCRYSGFEFGDLHPRLSVDKSALQLDHTVTKLVALLSPLSLPHLCCIGRRLLPGFVLFVSDSLTFQCCSVRVGLFLFPRIREISDRDRRGLTRTQRVFLLLYQITDLGLRLQFPAPAPEKRHVSPPRAYA